MKEGTTRNGIIEAMKDLSEILAPEPALDFLAGEEQLIIQMKDAAALLQQNDKINPHTALVLKLYGIEHLAETKSNKEEKRPMDDKKKSAKEEKKGVDKKVMDEFGFRTGTAASKAAASIMAGDSKEKTVKMLLKETSIQEERIASGKVTMIKRLLSKRGFTDKG